MTNNSALLSVSEFVERCALVRSELAESTLSGILSHESEELDKINNLAAVHDLLETYFNDAALLGLLREKFSSDADCTAEDADVPVPWQGKYCTLIELFDQSGLSSVGQLIHKSSERSGFRLRKEINYVSPLSGASVCIIA